MRKTAFALLIWGYPHSILARGLSLIWPEFFSRTLFVGPIGQKLGGYLGKISKFYVFRVSVLRVALYDPYFFLDEYLKDIGALPGLKNDFFKS